jgi:hypothetical protein
MDITHIPMARAFVYSTNYLIDTDHGVIVDVEATRSIRHVDEDARDVARALATTPEFEVACRRRKRSRGCSRI